MAAKAPWWKGERGEYYVIAQVFLFALVAFGPPNLPGWPAWPLPIVATVLGVALMVAGATLSVAGVLRLAKNGYFREMRKKMKRELTVVCVLTGHGLKDPDRAIASVKKFKTVSAKLDAVMKAIER